MIIPFTLRQKFTFICLLPVLVSSIFFSSCSKETPAQQHFFNYRFNNKAGGFTAINTMTLANMLFLDNGFTAQTDNGSLIIFATRGADFNVSGKPPCFQSTLVVPGTSPGTYILGLNQQGNFQIAEFLGSAIEQYSCNPSSPGSDNMTVVITELGAVVGLVEGTYSGTISGVQVSGNFKVERLS